MTDEVNHDHVNPPSVRTARPDMGVDSSQPKRDGGTIVLRIDIATVAESVAAAVAERLAARTTDMPWLDVEKAAQYLSCSPERIRKLVARREIPFHQDKPGGRVFFYRRELDEWLLAK